MLSEIAAGSEGNYIDTKSRYTKPAYIPPAVNQTAERYIKGMKKGTSRWRKLYGNRWKFVMNSTANKLATKEQVKMGPTYNELMERGDFWHPDEKEDRKLGGPGANQRAREDRAAASKPKEDPKKLKPGESYMDYAKRHGHRPAPKKKEGTLGKIKRRLGLKNSFEMDGNVIQESDSDPCWKGYTQVGMKMKNGKEVPNCVPSKGVTKAKGYKKESYDLKSFKQFCEGAAWTKNSGKSESGVLFR